MSFAANGVQTSNATVTISAAASVTDGVDFSATAHGMAIGDPVLHSGFTTNTDYNGVFIVTGVPDTGTYTIRHQGLAFGTTEAGTAEPGDTLGDAAGVVTGLSLGSSTQAGSLYQTQRRIYEATSAVALQLGGLLYINPEVDEIVFADNGSNTTQQIDITSGGILRIGRPVVKNGITRYSYGTAITSLPDGKSRSSNTMGWLEVQSGGLFEWHGGVLISVSGVLRWNDGASIVIKSQEHCVWLHVNSDGESSSAIIGNGQIRNAATDVTVTGFTDLGSLGTSGNQSEQLTLIGTPDTFEGFRPIHCNVALSTSSDTSVNPLFIGYKPLGNDSDYVGFGGIDDEVTFTEIEIRDNEKGTDISLAYGGSANHTLILTENYTLSVFDDAAAEITDDLLWFYRDVNHGSRFGIYTADLTYSGDSSDLVNFVSMYAEMISGGGAIDRRLDNDDTTDEASIAVWAYLYLSTSVLAIMKGSDSVEQSTSVFDDDAISETVRATVDAYTTLANGEQLYDRSKSEKISLTDDIIEFPDVATGLIAASGTILDLGDISLTIDGAAASAWALDQTGSGRITIDAGSVLAPTTNGFDTITTTGDVTIEDTTAVDDWTFLGELIIAAAQDFTIVTATLMNITDTSGATYILDECDITAVENSSGVDITVVLINGSTVPTLIETSGAITLVNDMVVTFTGLTAAVEYIYLEDDLGVQQFYAQATATTEVINIDLADDTQTWTYVVKQEGYDAQIGTFVVAQGTSLSIAVSLSQQLQGDGAVMYAGTTDALVTIEINNGTPALLIRIGDGIASVQGIYDEVQDALITATGMAWLADGRGEVAIDALVGDYIFMTDNVRLYRNAAGDALAEVRSFAYSTDGVPVDDTNGSVAFGAVLTDATTITDALAELVIKVDNSFAVSAAALAREY